jgi:hypothetical protein
MRAIKIDAEAKTVTEIELDAADNLSAMQTAVGGLIETAHELDNGDRIYVNEEGLAGNPQCFFEIAGGHQPFAGNGVVAGLESGSGKTKAAESSLSEIKSKVTFCSLRELKKRYSK